MKIASKKGYIEIADLSVLGCSISYYYLPQQQRAFYHPQSFSQIYNFQQAKPWYSFFLFIATSCQQAHRSWTASQQLKVCAAVAKLFLMCYLPRQKKIIMKNIALLKTFQILACYHYFFSDRQLYLLHKTRLVVRIVSWIIT